MIPLRQRNVIRQRIHFRIRQKMEGTSTRPRLNVYRSLNHIYAQIVDDAKGETLLSASTLAAKIKAGGNIAAAKEIGKLVAERALDVTLERTLIGGDQVRGDGGTTGIGVLDDGDRCLRVASVHDQLVHEQLSIG